MTIHDNRPSPTLLRTTWHYLLFALTTLYDEAILFNLPYRPVLKAVLAADLNTATDEEVCKLWESFAAQNKTEVKAILTVMTFILAGVVGLLSSSPGQASPIIVFMGLLTMVYGVECVLVTSFFGHYTLHIVKTSDQKWSWIKNAQESKHFRFLSPMHLVAIPLAWTLWSIVIFMTYLVLLFLAIGTEPPANDSNPTLSLPMQIMGPVMLVITVSYIIFALFSFIRLSMASNHHCLPLTRFDDPHCGTPPSQPPSDPPIPNGPSPDIKQPPHPPPNDTNSSTRGMPDHSQTDGTADPTSSPVIIPDKLSMALLGSSLDLSEPAFIGDLAMMLFPELSESTEVKSLPALSTTEAAHPTPNTIIHLRPRILVGDRGWATTTSVDGQGCFRPIDEIAHDDDDDLDYVFVGETPPTRRLPLVYGFRNGLRARPSAW